jgi:Penicillin binding protein transpeptidase domain/NTF2-like N-terminal transpeptidase domain/Penicillin-binding Protein dimerisation domain
VSATSSPRSSPRPRRKRSRPERLAPLAAAALIAFGVGMYAGAKHEAAGAAVARQWAAAWQRGDYARMHGLLSDASRKRASLKRFVRTYRDAGETLTLSRLRISEPRDAGDGAYDLPVALETRIFGRLRGTVRLPMVDKADGKAVDWHAELVFPGLRRGEKLTRETTLGERGDILARDGTPLAEGQDRLSDLGPLAAEVAGRVGPAPPDRAEELARRGVPDGAPVGLTGLEREFDERLAGSPGGVLRAGERVVARAEAREGVDVRTAIDPDVQRAAVEALAGRFGGIAVLRPATGEVLGLSGIAFSAPQPPGSTFKIITLAAALETGKVKPGASFPVQTETQLEGVKLQNAHGEACGGSLKASFAESCNSVFAPLGARVGAGRLVQTAERFGFNQAPGPVGAARSTIPAADEIGDDLAVGSSAIGQGKVLATPLELATVAATIGLRGRRVAPVLSRGAQGKETRAASTRSAAVIARFMRAVVTDGTGVGAAVPGVKVAGKTGTAELRSTVNDDPQPLEPGASPTPQPEEDKTDTDAWFVGFAPYAHPRVAVAVLLVGQGAGGETAAPAAKTVFQAAVG